ncbi:MAG: thioesterase [Bacteroidota bacterium]|nr:thioesterase [Bacteroidota bacterium]
MAYFAGVKIRELNDEQCVTTIKFGWINQNPFRSMYFACQAMAAEMSTGLLVMNGVYQSKPGISMLVIKNESVFMKKAVGKIAFTCPDGMKISETINKVRNSGEGVTVELRSTGRDDENHIVSEFVFTWSLKAKMK